MHDIQVPVLGISVFSFVVACIFVGLNQTSAWFIVKRLKGSDYFMLVAIVLDCGFMTTLVFAIHKGFGLHQDDIKPGNTVPINKAIWIFSMLYNLTSMAAKSAILAFYLKLTYRIKVFYRANCILFFIVNAVGLALTMTQVFQCHPVSAVFHLETQTKETCTNIFLTAISTSPYNLTTDIAILLIPVPLLTRISLPFKQRMLLVVVLSVGISVIVIDIIRIAFLQNTARTQMRELHTSYTEDITNQDYTRHDAYTIMWSFVEVNLTIVCACFPSLKPLATRISPALVQGPELVDEASIGTSAEGPSEFHHEMMEILTRPEKEKKRLGGRERYPRQIKLLNLLNLRPRRVLRLDSKQSLPPNIFVTCFFFVWGTAFGLLSVIAEKFQLPHIGPWQTYLTEGAYYLGYLPFPVLVGRIILKRLGFSASFISGLYIYAFGALLFWPAAILISFPMAFVSNFIIGSGLGVLEMAANLYIVICGPLDYSEIRLCVAQGFQGLGSLTSRLIADKLLLPRGDQIDGVINVQWVYLAIALFNVVLAICFYYIPIPEASEKDLQELAQLRPANNASGIFGIPVVYQTLFCGVCSQFFQIAANQTHIASFPNFVQRALPNSNLSTVDFYSIGTSIWSVSRFFAAFIQWMGFKPRWILLICYATCIVWAIICLRTGGLLAVVMDMLIWFTIAPIFPINYAISLRGLGVHSKTASFLLAACFCAGFMSYLARYGVEKAYGEPHPYILVVAFLSAGMLYPVYLNLIPAARRQVDPMKDEWIGDFDTGVY